MSHPIVEFSKVTPHIYLGTNLCCLMHAEKLEKLGASVDISLEYERTEIPKGFKTFVWLPVEDHHAPTIEQLMTGTAILSETEKQKYQVYVHCRNGHGRAPSLVIAYFLRKGMSYEAAYDFVYAKRPELEIQSVQRERLLEFETFIRGKKNFSSETIIKSRLQST